MEENVNFDNEVLAYLSVRKDELIESHAEYISKHPEIREVLNDFLSSVLLSKPVSASWKTNSRLGRCVRLCKRVLPSFQSEASLEQTTYSCWTIRSWQKNSNRFHSAKIWRSIWEEKILHHTCKEGSKPRKGRGKLYIHFRWGIWENESKWRVHRTTI